MKGVLIGKWMSTTYRGYGVKKLSSSAHQNALTNLAFLVHFPKEKVKKTPLAWRYPRNAQNQGALKACPHEPVLRGETPLP